MNFDINQVLIDMLTAIKGSVKKDGGKVKDITEQFFTHQKERLEELAAYHINGEITPEEFDTRLEQNKSIIEAELNAIKIVAKVVVQNATNAAIDVFNNAVKGAISTIL
jgi:hypothetical protein